MTQLFKTFGGRLRTKPPASFFSSVICLVLLLYSFLLCFSLCGDWFIVDDQEELAFIRNLEVSKAIFGPDTFGLFRPVKNLLFFVFVSFSGIGVSACRLVGIALGVLSFFPVLELSRRILGSREKAVLATSVWILSPTLVSSVAWLSCLNIQVMVAFAALAIVFHDKAWDGKSFRFSKIAIASSFLFLSLVSYECAVAVVPLTFLFDALLRPGRIRTKQAWSAYACHGTAICIYAILRHYSMSKTLMSGSWCQAERWQLALSSPWFTAQHFASWFWPFGRFTVLGSYKWGDVSVWTLAACWTLGLSVLAVAVWAWKRLPTFSFCLFFALIGFAPTSNCLGFGNGPYGDYYLSLASVGIAAGCVEAADRLVRVGGAWRRPACGLVLLFALVRLAATAESARWAWLWAHPGKAFETSVENFPSFVANKVGLIRFVCVEGRYEESLRLAREIEDSIGTDGKNAAGVHLVRAVHALVVLKDPDKALESLDRCEACHSRELTPRFLDYYRGCVFEDLLGNEAEARKKYESALGEDWGTDLVPCADRLARMEAVKGNLEKAIPLWQKAEKLDPENPSVLWNLAVAYRESGDERLSEATMEKTLRLTERPNFKGQH